MEEIIQSVLGIDRQAAEKEKQLSAILEQMEQEKNQTIRKLKEEITAKAQQEVEELRRQTEAEVARESERIETQSLEQQKSLQQTYQKVSGRVIQEAFLMILQQIEG